MNEFANAISKRSRDGQTIDEQEFLNYYADVNATLPSEKEEYFADVLYHINNSWLHPPGVSHLELIMSHLQDWPNWKLSYLKKSDKKQ